MTTRQTFPQATFVHFEYSMFSHYQSVDAKRETVNRVLKKVLSSPHARRTLAA